MLQYAQPEGRRRPWAAEFDALRIHRPNLLLEGPIPVRKQLLAQLLPHMPGAVVGLTTGGVLDLPLSATSIILHDIDALSANDQARLHAWMTSSDLMPQVVSTSEHSLYALVQRGRFAEDLYYRLNVVFFDLR
jgi:transcriptional regulator of acetoin/glycerol metabolism